MLQAHTLRSIKLRHRESIDAAKVMGEYSGHPKLDTALSSKAKQLKTDGVSVVEIAAKLKLSRPSVYKDRARNNFLFLADL